MNIRFSQLNAILQDVNKIPVEYHTQFTAKLRNLIRIGLKMPSGAGRGKKADFRPADLLKMAFAVELLQAGFLPEPAKIFTAENWPTVVEMMFASRKALRDGNYMPSYLVLEPAAAARSKLRFEVKGATDLADHLQHPQHSLAISQITIINVAAMLWRVTDAVQRAGLPRADFEADLDSAESIILEKGARFYGNG